MSGVAVEERFRALWDSIVGYIPNIIEFTLIIVFGLILAYIVHVVTRFLVNQFIVRPLETAGFRERVRALTFDLASATGVIAFLVVLTLALRSAAKALELPGDVAFYVNYTIDILLRVLAALAIVIFGAFGSILLVDFIKPVLATALSQYKVLLEMLLSFLSVALIALIITIALNVMGLPGHYVYPLLIGFIVMSLGIIIAGTLTGELEGVAEFRAVAPYMRLLIITIFILIGTGAIFSQFPGANDVIKVLSWGVAIAFAIALVPLAYKLIKTVT